jgi:hypothetical protein
MFGRRFADLDVEDCRARDRIGPKVLAEARDRFDRGFIECFGFDVATVANAAYIDKGNTAGPDGHGGREYRGGEQKAKDRRRRSGDAIGRGLTRDHFGQRLLDRPYVRADAAAKVPRQRDTRCRLHALGRGAPALRAAGCHRCSVHFECEHSAYPIEHAGASTYESLRCASARKLNPVKAQRH